MGISAWAIEACFGHCCRSRPDLGFSGRGAQNPCFEIGVCNQLFVEGWREVAQYRTYSLCSPRLPCLVWDVACRNADHGTHALPERHSVAIGHGSDSG